MSISEKTKPINNKIEENKAQYNLNRQATKISSISSVNLSKHEFLTNKDVLQEKKLCYWKVLHWKDAALERFENSPLGRLVLQKNSIKDSIRFLSLAKKKN